MNLLLVRHAIAGERDASRWPDDGDRPLTRSGKEKFARAAAGLKQLQPSVDLVLSSPFARAWQTAEILHDVTGWPKPERCDALEAGRMVSAIPALLTGMDGSKTIAMVGHEPMLHELCSIFVNGSEDSGLIEFKKGSVASIQFPNLVIPGSGVLRWLLPPKALRLLAG